MSGTPIEIKLFSKKAREFIEWLLGRYPNKQAALLPVLRLAEEEFGNIDDSSVMLVADTLDLSPGYVWGVLTWPTRKILVSTTIRRDQQPMAADAGSIPVLEQPLPHPGLGAA